MNLWRKIVRWLAREDIAAAYEAGSSMSQALMQPQTKLLQQMAHAQGELDGQQRFHDAILQAVHERMYGAQDNIVLEDDVKLAKTRSVH